ncbi:hypothetical protein V2J09_008489 [Rumex salicifolius]
MLMSQPRQFHHHHHMMGGGGGGGGQLNDTTLTKIFVGGLAWETQRDTMRKYFEQFGEILEAVVITDKATGRSKGYGFVTFKDPESAFRACQNPAPVIDGRKANCNLASLGAQKNRPPTAAHHVGSGQGWFRAGGAGPGLVAPQAAAAAAAFPAAASAYFQLQQSAAQLTFPYSAYGYTGFSHDTTMYPMSYYGVYGGQNLSAYYPSGGGGGGGSGAGGYFPNYYPYYGAYGASQGSQAQQHGGYGVHQYQHPHMVQYSSYLPGQHHQHSTSPGILSLPTSLALPPPSPTSSGMVATTIVVQGGTDGGASSAVSEHNSSST